MLSSVLICGCYLVYYSIVLLSLNITKISKINVKYFSFSNKIWPTSYMVTIVYKYYFLEYFNHNYFYYFGRYVFCVYRFESLCIYTVLFFPVFIFLFYLFCLLLQKSQLFSRWFSYISLFRLIRFTCGRPYRYTAHILEIWSFHHFCNLQCFCIPWEASFSTPFQKTGLGPRDILPEATRG